MTTSFRMMAVMASVAGFPVVWARGFPPGMSRVRPIRETDEMKSSRFSEEQIIGILKEQESGMSTAEVCRRHGISSATFYKWKAKFGGLEVSDARRLKQLEDENARLKRLLADAVLDNAMLKEIASKKF